MMKKSLLLTLFLSLLLSMSAVPANTQVPLEVMRLRAKGLDNANANVNATTNTLKPQSKFFRIVFPKKAKRFAANRPAIQPERVVTQTIIYPGSLLANIRRIARHFGWKRVVWTLPDDYRWVGRTRIQASSFQGILRQLLTDYPLQAVFYQGNHVLVIIPRTLQ